MPWWQKKAKPKTKPKPKIIKCPRCDEMGRVNAINRTSPKVPSDKETGKRKVMKELKREKIRYIVTHEKLPGSWGHRVAKRRRCCITSQKDRDYVLKKFGRYIEPREEIMQAPKIRLDYSSV